LKIYFYTIILFVYINLFSALKQLIANKSSKVNSDQNELKKSLSPEKQNRLQAKALDFIRTKTMPESINLVKVRNK